MLFANIGVSCRLWASEIGLRAPRKTSNGIPCLPRKSNNSGVAQLWTVFVNSHVLSSIFLTVRSQVTPIFVRAVGVNTSDVETSLR